MNSPFPAIYENGVLKPLHPVDFKEHEVVSLAIVNGNDDATRDSNELVQRQRTAMNALLEETAALPLEGPVDGLSGRDHDLVLYGWRK